MRPVGRDALTRRRWGSVLASLTAGLTLGGVPLAIAHPAFAQASASLCPSQLEAGLNTIIDRPQFQRARWGILIQTLGERQTLYARNAEQFFIPASNVKLLTTAAALTHLGSEFRLRTSVYVVSNELALITPASAIAPLTLVLVGQGDPSVTDIELDKLAQQVQQQGITQVTTLVAVDADVGNAIGNAIGNPTWEWEDLQMGYGAPANQLILNENELALTFAPQQLGQPVRVSWNSPRAANDWQIENTSLTVATETAPLHVGRDLSQPTLYVSGQLSATAQPVEESIAITQPTAHFLEQFRQRLVEQGIAVSQTAIAPVSPWSARAIAAIESPPLSTLLETTNQQSNNLYAEALLRILGMRYPAQRPEFGLDGGIEAIEAILTDLGIDPSGYALADGSGLSRHNLVTPTTLVDTLQHMASVPDAAIYRQSLAVAGISGTLRNRFRDMAVTGRLWGKTGALSGVAALSGYLEPPHHPPLVFSIVLNHFEEPVSTVRPAIDQIVIRLSQLQVCSD